MRKQPRRVLALTALACAASLCLFSAACASAASPTQETNAARAASTPAPRADPSAVPAASPATAANANASATPAVGAGEDLTERGDTSKDDFEGTVAAVEKERPGVEPAVLVAVRTARHANFERVVFEFQGETPPGYRIEYVDEPVRQCGSGEEVRLAGDAQLQVRLRPSRAHTEAGEATVKERSLRLDYVNLKELKALCDFEADVEWVLGLASPNRYRVLELSKPARIVVDVKAR